VAQVPAVVRGAMRHVDSADSCGSLLGLRRCCGRVRPLDVVRSSSNRLPERTFLHLRHGPRKPQTVDRGALGRLPLRRGAPRYLTVTFDAMLDWVVGEDAKGSGPCHALYGRFHTP
jgi:hypothetical protein